MGGKVLNKKQLVVILFLLFCNITAASAYNENYPPYKFGSEFKNHFKLQNLAGDKPVYEEISFNYKDKKGIYEAKLKVKRKGVEYFNQYNHLYLNDFIKLFR